MSESNSAEARDLARPPHRCFEITVRIGADTWPDLVAELEQVAFHVGEHGPGCNSVSGSPSRGHIVEIRHDPEMTHDRYFAAVEQYRASLKRRPDSELEVARWMSSPDGVGPEGA